MLLESRPPVVPVSVDPGAVVDVASMVVEDEPDDVLIVVSSVVSPVMGLIVVVPGPELDAAPVVSAGVLTHRPASPPPAKLL